ncbi:two-component sensor histidine kinase involved in phosphate regulation [Alkalihalophilus pseudofirmus OF4]|uniref:histidine kinase n=1 Tax=Alkalihalophilus pseudofirmus (strain ATCC BAA-2126 / JCM 17055 / OF4) TaxID=398511 RepID=D3FWY0_ALKPO|nr:ATP-binding protein [Alkalihalophilus pseudofirmus]ADC48735.1 two-component sensor histidine kinase involved in phosphate regulation [Alkalihalophilus pseudofirmus OF4]
MHKLKFRLVFAILSVTLLVMASLGLVIGQVYKNIYENHLTDRLMKEAELAAFTIESHSEEAIDEQQLALRMSERLDARVTIIAADGTVLGESATDPEDMDNHADRPEIREVREGKNGTEMRYSDTIGQELLYYAVPYQVDAEQSGYVRLGLATQTIAKLNETIWTILIVSFTVAFIVIGAITYRIANEMIRPIENASEVAIELAEGNFKARTFEGKQDEVGQLTRSMNVLAYNLEQITKRHEAQQERLETLINNMGSGLIFINTRGDISLINQKCHEIFEENTDKWLNQLYHEVFKSKELIKIVQTIFITEKRHREQIQLVTGIDTKHFDIQAAPILSEMGMVKGIVLVLHDITELKKLEQVRKDFVANVSHELKTPVTSIKGFSETLLDGAMADPAYMEKFLTIIHKESERLQSLIQDLLELSKLEQHYFRLNWGRAELTKIVQDAVELLRPKAEAKEIALSLHAASSVEMDGDSERLKQVAINLISNAITYTPNHGEINVSVTQDHQSILFTVSDNGIGIESSELPRIFERFYRVDRARSRNSGGTGLGLAIVKHLVEAHNGKLSVESELGHGTTFTIHFMKDQMIDQEKQ